MQFVHQTRRASLSGLLTLAGLITSGAAHAACAPVAASNVSAICSGMTIDQNGTNGYGTGTETNLNVTVVQGATVTGTLGGIGFLTGFVNNAGTITGLGTNVGGVVSDNSLIVINTGLITGDAAVGAYGVATVTNSGTIRGQINGIIAGSDANVVNSGSITGAREAILSYRDINLTNSGTVASTGAFSAVWAPLSFAAVVNSGTIAGGDRGIDGDAGVTLTNSGTITGQRFGVLAGSGPASVINSGSISSNQFDAILAGSSVTVTNSGSIISRGANSAAIFAGTRATVSNSGNISGNMGVVTSDSGDVSNSGTIIGTSGTAIQFGFNPSPGNESNTLAVLPGARFGGLIAFGGGADRVNFGAGSWIINTANFNATLSTVTTPGNPYFVTPNQIVVADVSGFGAQNRAIMEISGWIASVLPDAPVFAPALGGSANSFAATDGAASPFDSFASSSTEALGYAATKAPVFKAGAVNYADGSAVWAKAFGGQRQQDSSAAAFGSTTTGYGGAVGYERVLNPELKVGVLIGGSANRTDLHQNAGSTSTDTVFGGLYGRATRGGGFLDLSVIGGNLDNRNARNIGGGLPLETASASYGGWFVTPAMMAGHRFEIDGRGFTITPAFKARYLAAHFGGYTESGSAANLNVGGRAFQAFEERAEITLANTRTIWNGHRVTARVSGGLLAQQRTTGNQVNVVLLGQNFVATTPDRGSVAGSYAAAGIDWQMGRVTLFAAGEGTYTNDVARSYAGKGGMRVSW